jgi:hypothetical protein
VCHALKERPCAAALVANSRRVSALERAYGTVEGIKAPKGRTP